MLSQQASYLMVKGTCPLRLLSGAWNWSSESGSETLFSVQKLKGEPRGRIEDSPRPRACQADQHPCHDVHDT